MNRDDVMWTDNYSKTVHIDDRHPYYRAEVGGMYFRITEHSGGGWLAAWGLVGLGRAADITLHPTRFDAADWCVGKVERRIAILLGELS